MIVTDDRVARFVAQVCQRPIVPPYTVVGIEKGGEIIAGVVFNHYTRTNVHVTVAGHGWTRGFIAEIGRYVYGTLGCLRMTIVTEQPAIVRIAERLGGQVEGLMRDQFGPGRDGFLVGILKQDWKFDGRTGSS